MCGFSQLHCCDSASKLQDTSCKGKTCKASRSKSTNYQPEFWEITGGNHQLNRWWFIGFTCLFTFRFDQNKWTVCTTVCVILTHYLTRFTPINKLQSEMIDQNK